MKVIIAETYELLCKTIMADVEKIIQPINNPVLCTASGDSPAGLYKELVGFVRNNQTDISGWKFIGLDEWVGLNGNDEGSCRFHLNQQLFYPLKVAEDDICFFNGRTGDLQNECKRTDEFIKEHGGIDVAFIGLGLNGHIGMNEPGTAKNLYAHVIKLDELTAKTGQKYFNNPQALTQGITLGLASLMEARHVMLIVSGKHKAGIVKKMVEEEISIQMPATILRQHAGCTIYLDEEAASQIESEKYEQYK